MSKYRRAAKIDNNQNEIVNALRDINGVTVQVGMDDILVGYKGRSYWFEIKEPSCVSPKTGMVRHSSIKESQHKLIEHWTGHYEIVWDISQILLSIGIK